MDIVLPHSPHFIMGHLEKILHIFNYGHPANMAEIGIFVLPHFITGHPV